MEIRARSLTRAFPAPGWFPRRRRHPAVRGVSFRVRDGEITALAGENGSGKTTTLRLLAGLLTPDAGEALLGGAPVVSARARRGLGYVAEADQFPPSLEVGEALRLGAALAGLAREPGARASQQVAARLDLEPWLRTRTERCSRGIRRRLSLALALLDRPTALLLDEPFTGLDPVARASSLAAVRDAASEGAAVVVSLHEPASIAALAHRLVVLHQGRVVAAGPVADFHPGGEQAEGVWLRRALESHRAETR